MNVNRTFCSKQTPHPEKKEKIDSQLTISLPNVTLNEVYGMSPFQTLKQLHLNSIKMSCSVKTLDKHESSTSKNNFCHFGQSSILDNVSAPKNFKESGRGVKKKKRTESEVVPATIVCTCYDHLMVPLQTQWNIERVPCKWSQHTSFCTIKKGRKALYVILSRDDLAALANNCVWSKRSKG